MPWSRHNAEIGVWFGFVANSCNQQNVGVGDTWVVPGVPGFREVGKIFSVGMLSLEIIRMLLVEINLLVFCPRDSQGLPAGDSQRQINYIPRLHWPGPRPRIQVVEFQECSTHVWQDATVLCLYTKIATSNVLYHVRMLEYMYKCRKYIIYNVCWLIKKIFWSIMRLRSGEKICHLQIQLL